MYITSAKAVMFFCADNVLRRRGLLRSLCHDICVYVTVRGCVCQHDKTKTPERNDLKLGTAGLVVIDSLSKPIDSVNG